jgi:predicted nucleotidyltransferase
VNRHDPNLAKIELIANVLGPLRERLVFVGGCAAGLLLTDPAAAPARVTYDVDLTVQVAALADYHRLEDEFRALGFTRDLDMEVICRWRYRDLEVDLMPTDPAILGFANRWYPLVVKTAQSIRLPAGFDIRLITAPAFLATKFEAFADRGKGNLLASHDLEDIITVLDGRPELPQEIADCSSELRSYLSTRCRNLMAAPAFFDYLPGMITPSETLGERVAILTDRLQQIARLA